MSFLSEALEVKSNEKTKSLLNEAIGVEEGEVGALPVETETRPSWRDSIGRALSGTNMAELESIRESRIENAPSEFLLHAGAGAAGWGAGKAAGLGNIGLGVLAGTMANDEQKAELLQGAEDPELAYSQKLKGLTRRIDETVAEKVGTLGGLLRPPKTEGAQKALELAEKALSPIQKAGQWADEALTKAGFPTAGFVAGFATELALFKAAHVGAKRVGKFVKSMSLEEVNSLARQFESLSDQALKRQVEESLAKALAESNDPRFDKFKAEYENELQFRKQAVQARAEAMTEAGLEPPADKFAVEAGLVEEQQKSVAQLLRETTADQKESHEQFVSEHVKERDAVKKLADIRRKNLESQQRATDVTAIKEQIGIVPKLEPEITQRLRVLQGESKPAVKPLEGETANDFIARMKAEGRIPEKAYRGEVKPEEVLESIPPEVSGLDDFVYMTREGKLVDDRGREVTFPEKTGEVEAAKPEAVPEAVEASKPVVEPVAEPVVEPVANSNQNLMGVEKPREAEVVEPVVKREQLDLDRLPDWVEQNLEDFYRDAEELGLLGKIQSAVEAGKTTKEILDQYVPKGDEFKDQRSELRKQIMAVRMLENGDIGDQFQTFRKWYNEESEFRKRGSGDGEGLVEGVERVNPETGRAAGVAKSEEIKTIQAIDKGREVKPLDSIEQLEKVIDSRTFESRAVAQYYAIKRSRETGQEFKVGKNPDELYVVESPMYEKTSEQVVKRIRAEVKGFMDVIGNERGSIDPQLVKTLMDEAKRQGKSVHSMLRGLGFSGEEIRKVTGVASETGIKAGKPVPSAFPQADEKVVFQRPSRMSRGRQVSYVPVTNDLAEAVITTKLETSRIGEWVRTPHTVFDKAEGLRNRLLYPWRAARQAASFEKKALSEEMVRLTKEYSRDESHRVGNFAIAQQQGGVEALKAAGVEIVTQLTEHEQGLYKRIREAFDETHTRLNDVRTKIGLDPIRKVNSYYSFMTNVKNTEGAGRLLALEDVAILDRVNHMASTPFSYAKKRGQVRRGPLETNSLKVFERYMTKAVDHIHISPIAALVEELFKMNKNPKTEKYYNLEQFNPSMARFLNDWKLAIMGVNELNMAAPAIAKLAKGMRRNLTLAIIGGYARTALIQPTALVNTTVRLGPIRTLEGMMDNLSPGKRKRAFELSKVLDERKADVALTDLHEFVTQGRVKTIKDKAGQIALTPVRVFDYEAALATWNAAFREGMKELGERGKAANFADDVVVKTQGSSASGELSKIQSNEFGKLLTLFQTFTINNWNFLTNDVIGYKNAAITNKTAFKRVFYTVMAYTATNILFEDFLHMNSPFPAPIRAASKALGGEGSDVERFLKASVAAMKEGLELTPVMGSTKYGMSPFGPAAEFGKDVAEVMSGEKDLLKKGPVVAGEALGIPGTKQIERIATGISKGRSLKETVLGPSPGGEYTTGQDQERRGRRRERRNRERR